MDFDLWFHDRVTSAKKQDFMRNPGKCGRFRREKQTTTVEQKTQHFVFFCQISLQNKQNMVFLGAVEIL